MPNIDVPRIPYLDGDWWYVARNPDLGGIYSKNNRWSVIVSS